MPRPMRSKITTAVRPAPDSAVATIGVQHLPYDAHLQDKTLAIPNTSLESSPEGRDQSWSGRSSTALRPVENTATSLDNGNFMMSGALRQADIEAGADSAQSGPESSRLRRAKMQTKKYQEKASKAIQIERRKSLRKSSKLVAQVSAEELERAGEMAVAHGTSSHGFQVTLPLSPSASTHLLVQIEGSHHKDRYPNLDIPPTPSMLSLANFKQRPRQPSILTMVQQSEDADALYRENTPASADDSILAALQQSSPTQVDKIPEPISSSPLALTSSSRKRNAESMFEARLSDSGKRQRSERHAQHDCSSSTPPARPGATRTRSLANSSNRESLKHYQPSATIMATSPVSSPQSSQHPNINADSTANQQVPANIQHIKTATLQALLPKRMKTARDGYRDTFDIYDTSDLEQHSTDGVADEDNDDLDELSRPVRRRRNPKPAPEKGSKNKKGAPLTRPIPKTRGRKPLGKIVPKAVNTVPKPATGPGGKTARTYGRGTTLDIENDVEQESRAPSEADAVSDGDESIVVGRAGPKRTDNVSSELKQARDKFKKIDEWDLEFESCDVGGGSSSPWR